MSISPGAPRTLLESFHVLCSGCPCFVLDVATFEQTMCGSVLLHPITTSPALQQLAACIQKALDMAGIDGSSLYGHGFHLAI